MNYFCFTNRTQLDFEYYKDFEAYMPEANIISHIDEKDGFDFEEHEGN